MKFKQRGFTLIEMMIVLVILAVIAAFAIPNYQEHLRKKDVAAAQQYIGCIAMELDRHKAKNFSYKGFAVDSGAAQQCVAPEKYNFTLVDLDAESPLTDANANGLNWAMKAEATDERLFSLLRNSVGAECKNKAHANISWTSCGTGGEGW